MNIAHVCLPTLPVLYERGGAIQRRALELAKAQAKLGNHNIALFSIGDESRTIAHDGISIYYIKCERKGILKSFEYQFKVIQQLKKQAHTLDVLHVHNFPEGILFAHKLTEKTFLSYDFYKFRKGKRTPYSLLTSWCLDRYTRLLPVSYYAQEKARMYWRLPERKFQILYNGVNLSQFFPDPKLQQQERSRLGLQEYEKVVLYVGRVNRQKGIHVLLEAMERITPSHPDIRLVVAGPIAQFGTSESGSDLTQGITNINGTYLGAVHEDRLNAVYNLADVFVMPTIKLEMFGMATIEAQACGKPVIASDHGGLRETVPHDCGARFQTGNSQQLSDCIVELLNDEDLRASCSHAAQINSQQYAWDRIGETALQIYAT